MDMWCLIRFNFLCVNIEAGQFRSWNWLPNVGHSATWVARCSRAMPQRRQLCMINPVPPVGIFTMRVPLAMPAMLSWLAGSNPPACSIWPLPWLPTTCLIFSCRYAILAFNLIIICWLIASSKLVYSWEIWFLLLWELGFWSRKAQSNSHGMLIWRFLFELSF